MFDQVKRMVLDREITALEARMILLIQYGYHTTCEEIRQLEEAESDILVHV